MALGDAAYNKGAGSTGSLANAAQLTTAADITANKEHLILSKQGLRSFTAAQYSYAYLNIDGVSPDGITDSGFSRVDNATADAQRSHYGHVFSDAPATDIAIDFTSQDASGVIYTPKILAIEIDDIKADTTQYIETVTDHAAVTFTSGIIASSLTLTPNEAGEVWLIFGTYQLSPSGAATQNQAQIRLDSSTILTRHRLQSPSDSTNNEARPLMAVWTAPDTTAVTMETYLTTNEVAAQLNSSGIYAIRLKSISTNYVVVDYTNRIQTYEQSVAATFEDVGMPFAITGVGGDIVMIASGYHDPGTATRGGGLVWTPDNGSTLLDNSENWNHNGARAPSDTPGVFDFYLDAAVTGAKTYDVYGGVTDAADSLHDLQGVVMEMDGGDGGYVATTMTAADMGDLSSGDIIQMASDAGVTLTSAEVVGKLNEIAGTSGLEYQAALTAAAAVIGITWP